MAFTPKNWQNSPSAATPLSAEAMEDLEVRVTDYTDTQVQPLASSTVDTISVTTSRALALTDVASKLRVSSGSTVTLTVPANATVAFPVGSVIEVFRLGSGAVAFSAAGGVTVNAMALNIAAQYAGAVLHKVATNEWDLVGNLA